jgi:hypothetical protein
MKKMRWMFLLVVMLGTLWAQTPAAKEEDDNTWRTLKSKNTGEAPPAPSEVEKLRRQQKADLDRLKEIYDQRARSEVPKTKDGKIDTDSPAYKNLEKEYLAKDQGTREAYQKRDPRLKDFEPGNQIEGVKSTGSAPKDVRADGDWTADTPEAAKAKQEQWTSRGDTVVDEGHKVVNKTTDEVLWKPGQKAGSEGLVGDGDAHGTEGGREKVTRTEGQHGTKSGEGVRDPEGYALDNEKKFIDAQKRGNLKDQAKTVSKLGDATGHSSDPAKQDLYDKAKTYQQYGDEIRSGVSHLGEEPDVRKEKVDKFQQELDAEMRNNVADATQKGKAIDDTRGKLAESAKKAETTGNKAWDDARNKANYGDTPTTSEAIEGRRDAVAEGNRATAEANQKARTDLETKGPRTDAPDVGKVGKGLDAAGKGLAIIDIGSTAEDIKQQVKKGDYTGAAKTAGEFGADEATMGLYSANKKIWGSNADAWQADRATEAANKTHAEAFDLEAENRLRNAGMDKAEVKKLLEEKAKGNDGPLYQAFKEHKVTAPQWVDHEYEKADDTAGQRAKDLAAGIAEGAQKTAKFGWETSNEAALGLGKLIYGTPDDVKIAKEAMADRLVAMGASPVGAEKAAEAYFGQKDSKPLEELSAVLAQKKADREQAAKLKGEEGTSAETEGAVDTNPAAGVEGFAGKKEADQEKKTEQSFETMSQNSAMAEAAKAGDSDKLQAKNVKESSGQEFKDAMDESAKKAAAADQKDSWGNTLGKALEDGLTQGAETFGAELGNAAAQKANEKIYGPDKPEKEEPPPGESAGGGQGGGAPVPGVPGTVPPPEVAGATPQGVPPPPSSVPGEAVPPPADPNAPVPPTSTDTAITTGTAGTSVTPPSTTPPITTVKPAATAVPAYSGTKACARCSEESQIPKQEQLCLRCCTQVMSSYNTYCFTEGRNGGADEPYFGMLSAGTRAQIESQAARDREAWKNRPPIQNGPVDTTE